MTFQVAYYKLTGIIFDHHMVSFCLGLVPPVRESQINDDDDDGITWIFYVAAFCAVVIVVLLVIILILALKHVQMRRREMDKSK